MLLKKRLLPLITVFLNLIGAFIGDFQHFREIIFSTEEIDVHCQWVENENVFSDLCLVKCHRQYGKTIAMLLRKRNLRIKCSIIPHVQTLHNASSNSIETLFKTFPNAFKQHFIAQGAYKITFS